MKPVPSCLGPSSPWALKGPHANCAIAALLANQPEACLAACAKCLMLDLQFLPAYLHRARAERALRQFPSAAQTLAAAARLATMYGPDIKREADLVALEQRDREAHGPDLEDFFETLGMPVFWCNGRQWLQHFFKMNSPRKCFRIEGKWKFRRCPILLPVF